MLPCKGQLILAQLSWKGTHQEGDKDKIDESPPLSPPTPSLCMAATDLSSQGGRGRSYVKPVMLLGKLKGQAFVILYFLQSSWDSCCCCSCVSWPDLEELKGSSRTEKGVPHYQQQPILNARGWSRRRNSKVLPVSSRGSSRQSFYCLSSGSVSVFVYISLSFSL